MQVNVRAYVKIDFEKLIIQINWHPLKHQVTNRLRLVVSRHRPIQFLFRNRCNLIKTSWKWSSLTARVSASYLWRNLFVPLCISLSTFSCQTVESDAIQRTSNSAEEGIINITYIRSQNSRYLSEESLFQHAESVLYHFLHSLR